ncbi:PREDICTED: noelin-like [Priapulus caudatus]|uniref:Noelin-like n=1 Tax=Priapulus caudatus TaxID=37621 RepID=A0ABM1E986_PRICU|nr:PREDICTED: noelin-like [Priapulus caudatus]
MHGVNGQFVERFNRLSEKYEAMQTTRGFVIRGRDLRKINEEIDQLSKIATTLVQNDTETNLVHILDAKVRNISEIMENLELTFSSGDSSKEKILGAKLRNLSAIIESMELAESSRDSVKEQLANLEERFLRQNGTPTSPVNCGKEALVSVSEPWTNRWMGTEGRFTYGAWFKDPLPTQGNEDKFYYASFASGVLYEFANYSDFVSHSNPVAHSIPNIYSINNASGLCVYNGSFYFVTKHDMTLFRYNLHKQRTVVQRPLGYRLSKYPYSNFQHTNVDLEADEKGLWAIYGIDGRIIISKVDPVLLSFTRTWNTVESATANTPRKRSVGNAFFICGIMYAIRSHETPDGSIFYAYDTNTSREVFASIPIHVKYGLLGQLSYNARERVLYGYDNGHMITYPLHFAPVA